MAKTWHPVIDYLTCTECGTCVVMCPHGVYDTGWKPPKGEQTAEGSCSSCGCDCASEKKIIVEYLYLDLQTCERCIGTDSILDEVMLVLTPALKLAGFTVEYKKIEMKTAEIAIQHRFLSSPSIRVNGHDICQSVSENSCGCCSEISDTGVECRVFEYDGQTFEVPPKEMLAESILQCVFGPSDGGCSCDRYELPENLKSFFDGKNNKSSCCREDNCC